MRSINLVQLQLMRRAWVLALWLLPFSASGADVAAILSSEAPHYREAFQDFQAAYGSTVPMISLDAPVGAVLPKEYKVAVTFGARAAAFPLPKGVGRVICLAPVLPQVPAGPSTRLQLLPVPAAVARGLKDVQPGLKTLTVFWVSSDFDAYVAGLERALKSAGAALSAEKLDTGDALSARLGALKDRPEALWVPPDPALINNVNVSALLQYSSFNRVPFYSPNAQFVEMGAAAAAAPGREDMARLAAAAVRDFLAGRAPTPLLMPEKAELVLNRSALEHVKLPASPELQKKAKTVH